MAELGCKGEVGVGKGARALVVVRVSRWSVVNFYITLLELGIYSPVQRMVCLQTSTSTHRGHKGGT